MESPDAFSARTGVHRIPIFTPFIVGPVNVYLIKNTTQPLTLVDTGTLTERSWEELIAGLQSHGVAPADLQRLILTHHHVDHVGLCHRIKSVSSAEVWGHPNLAEQDRLAHAHDEAQRDFFINIMEEFGVPHAEAEQAMALWERFKTFTEPAEVDRTVEHGGTLGPFTVHFVPGHSSTDTLFVNEAEGYTLAGDHILEDFNPNPLIRRPIGDEPRVPALVEYQASLTHSRRLPLGTCLPGHGAIIRDPFQVIDGILSQHERKNRRILDNIGPEGFSPFELAQVFYPGQKLEHLYLGLSVATGHLEVLEARGLMRSELQAGVIRYFKLDFTP